MKATKSRKKIVLPVILIGLILLGVSYYFGFFFYIGISPCLIPLPPSLMADGIARAKVYTWYDENENGMVDQGEAALPGVEIAYPPHSDVLHTDELGNAETGAFKAGCACNCWENEFVEVIAPKGYRPTTPLRHELAGDNLLYTFGFVKITP